MFELMAFNIRRLFVIVPFFLIMLFIEGVAVPRYLSNLRSQASFKPFASNSKLASNVNLPSIDTNANKSIVTRNDRERYDFFSDSFQKPIKTNRNKRQILLNKSSNDTFFWNFNLNITRYGNIPIASKDSKASFGKKHSVAVFAEGQGLRQTALKDMHEALESVEKLIQDVHGESNESVTYYHNSLMNKSMSFQKENSDSSLVPDFNISSPTNKSNQSGETQNQIQSFKESPKASNLEASYQLKITDDENQTSVENGREGRIWFNILEYGGKLLGRNKPTSGTETTQNLTDKLEIVSLKADSSSEFPVTPDIEAEKSQREFNAHSDFLESTTKHTTTVEVDQVENFELQHTLKRDECFDCAAESFELSDPSMKDPSKKESHPVKFSFTEETIESFCKSILKKLEFRELSNSEVNTSDPQLISENEKATPRSSQNLVLGHKNLPNTLDEKDLKTYGTIIEDNFFLENNELKDISTDILNRFLNMFEGSGRSAETENESALISDLHFDKLDHLLSVSDCEVYFNNKRHKKTLLNSNTDLSIKNTFDQDFEITTLSLQEMQLSIPRNISIQSFDKSFEKADSNTEKTSHEDENTTEKKIFSGNDLKTQSSFGFDELIGISESEDRIQETTEEQRNGRIFNFFDLGSGREDQGGIESIRRWFPSFFGGSGARALEDLTEQFDAVDENGSGETFLRNVEFSGDERIITVSERDTLHFDTATEKNWGPLSILSFAESGSGREFAKSTEFTLDFENKSDCDDCFSYSEQLNENSDRNSTDESINNRDELDNFHENLDCNCQHKSNTQDGNGTLSECDDCNLEIVEGFNTLNMNAKNLVITEVPLTHINLTKLKDENEFDCNDCYSDGERLNENVDRSSIEESVSHRGDLRDYDETTEDCSCLHKNSLGTEILSECDCSLDTVQVLNKPNINFESPILKEISLIPENLTKLEDEYTYDCNDCNHEINQEKVTETNTTVEILKINDHIESDDSVDENKTDTVKFSLNFEESTTDYQENTAGLLKPPITTKDLLVKHEANDTPSLRFMGTIFLTGSGDGGLFGEDNGGPINLVEEESTVSPILLSRRKARLDETINEPSSERGPLNPNLHSRRRGRLDDSNFNDNFTTLLEEKINNANSRSEHFSIKTEFITTPSDGRHKMEGASQETLDIKEGKDVAFSSIIFNSPTRFPEVFETATRILPRFCVAAKDCNVTLNERCITVNNLSSCDCGRSLVRHKETRKCVGKRYVETTLKLPAEMFDANLRNPESARYKQMSKKSIEMMWNLLKETPEALQVVTEVNVRSFTAGSLIVKLNLVLAVETKAEMEVFKSLENKLQRALRDKNLVEKSSLNIRNASVLSITIEINPCKSQELNYCSQNAYCIWNEDYPEMFTCHCKEHYQDVSSDSHYPGEMCIAKCSPLYCGPNGHCEILDGGKKNCLCRGLYFGERCEVPGMVILSTLSVAAFITLAVLFGVVICFKYKRSYSRSPTFKRSEEMEHALAIGRVSDAIALGESRAMKISKFSQLSTPVQDVPIIKVTRPTLNESSISCDFDSSFDSTSRNEEGKVPPSE